MNSRLKTSGFFSATGNHDVRSRSAAQTIGANPIRQLSVNWGVFEKLKCLEPPYPVVTTSLDERDAVHKNYRTKYFGDGFVLVTNERYRILIINSCAEHTSDPAANERGTFPESAEQALIEELANCVDCRINVAVLHHPPETHGRYSAGAHDFVERGEDLLRHLSEHGHWLVIHGHKHDGRIRYASGAGRSPTIFAAASLASHLSTDQPGQRNQFYLLDVHLSSARELQGTVRAWNWYAGKGWELAHSDDDGIFEGCGFGCRDTPEQIAFLISQTVQNLGISLPCSWNVVESALDKLRYLPPDSLVQACKALKENYQIMVVKNSSGRRVELAKVL